MYWFVVDGVVCLLIFLWMDLMWLIIGRVWGIFLIMIGVGVVNELIWI